MYGYEEYNDISPEQLLQKVTQEQIFEFILRKPFSYEDRYLSPFRLDTRPGCRFEQRSDNTILFVDFVEKNIRPDKTHRNCFNMVMDKYNCNLNRAINIILSHFNLSTNSLDYNEVSLTQYDSKEKPTNSPIIFKYEKTDYN